MARHAFSPITDEARLQAATAYIAANSLRLAKAVLGRELPIDTICFFTHSPEEYAFLERAVLERGPKSERLSHGPTLYVDSDFTVEDQHIRIFGVRQPDSTRPWVGYGDYPVDGYPALLKITRANPYAREIISGRGRSLLELRHPDFDVLGFVVDQKDHL